MKSKFHLVYRISKKLPWELFGAYHAMVNKTTTKLQQMNVMLFRSFGLLHVILLIATTLNVANASL